MDITDTDRLGSQIKMLKIAYLVLFLSSLAILVAQQTMIGFGTASTIAWAVTLGGAVIVRLRKKSLARRYDELR
jgi:hypothetical protein